MVMHAIQALRTFLMYVINFSISKRLKMISIQRLLILALLVILHGCASAPPFVAQPGMKFEELNKKAYASFCGFGCTYSGGGLIYKGNYDGLPNLRAYITIPDDIKINNGQAMAPERYYIFNNGILIDDNELNRLSAAREAEENKAAAAKKAREAKEAEEFKKRREIMAARTKSLCRSPATAKGYVSIIEEMSNRLQVYPNSIGLAKLEWIEEGEPRTFMSGKSCWGTYHTPRGAAFCEMWFDSKGVIFRVDCNSPIGQICAGSCNANNR